MMFLFLRIPKAYSCRRNRFTINWKYSQETNSAKPVPRVGDCRDERYAVIRVDTHGNRFIVQQLMSKLEAKQMEADFDLLTHHQGYYVVSQKDVEKELKR